MKSILAPLGQPVSAQTRTHIEFDPKTHRALPSQVQVVLTGADAAVAAAQDALTRAEPLFARKPNADHGASPWHPQKLLRLGAAADFASADAFVRAAADEGLHWLRIDVPHEGPPPGASGGLSYDSSTPQPLLAHLRGQPGVKTVKWNAGLDYGSSERFISVELG
ncbi:MAG: hypothetical protein IPJ65_05010 [Archangiaceae bacterium]|nr:hypothetical protein [Archangiaceae bacterium]